MFFAGKLRALAALMCWVVEVCREMAKSITLIAQCGYLAAESLHSILTEGNSNSPCFGVNRQRISFKNEFRRKTNHVLLFLFSSPLGITLENGKRYSQKVDDGFHVSMAALEFNAQEIEKKKNVSVMIEHDKSEFLLCSLRHGSTVQQNLALNFNEDEEVTFFINGPGTVHLTGYLIENDEMEGFYRSDCEESDEENESEDDTPNLKRKIAAIQKKNAKKSKLQDFDDLSDEDIDEDDEDESDDNLKALQFSQKKGVKAVEKVKNGNEVKQGQSPKTKQTPKKTQAADKSVANGPETPNESLTASGKKKRRKKRKKSMGEGDVSIEAQMPKTPLDASKKAETAKTPKKVAETAVTPKKMADKAATPKSVRKIAGGISVEDSVVGNGPVAKRGKFVQIGYVGKLLNNTVFDKSKKSNPLGFRLGSGEVIKGMDLGVEGMKVGGKRKLVIPAHQAYGNKAEGPIPSNSTLHFWLLGLRTLMSKLVSEGSVICAGGGVTFGGGFLPHGKIIIANHEE
uniref:peptidylprolyl isomerase n=1 Tax=Strigamia maritima TaxID=126957 RepID=T1JKR5_STRMM